MLVPLQIKRRLARRVVTRLDRGAALRDAGRQIVSLRLDNSADDGIRRDRHRANNARDGKEPDRIRRKRRWSAACPAFCSIS